MENKDNSAMSREDELRSRAHKFTDEYGLCGVWKNEPHGSICDGYADLLITVDREARDSARALRRGRPYRRSTTCNGANCTPSDCICGNPRTKGKP